MQDIVLCGSFAYKKNLKQDEQDKQDKENG
jgi:hypothetical protein